MFSKIAFRKRGLANKFAIEQSELVDLGDGQVLNLKRGPSEQELPNEVRLIYSDYDADYQQGAQYTRRLTGVADGSVSVEIPLVTNADHAKHVTEVMLYLTWLTRQQYEFATDQRYAHIEPTDAGTVNCDGYTHTIRITKKDEQPDGVIKFEAVADDTTLYERGEPGVPMPPRGQLVRGSSPSMPALLDIPWFRINSSVSETGAYFYPQALRRNSGIDPAVLMVSRDDGATWQSVAQTTIEPTFGIAVTALGAGITGGAFIPDEVSEVTVYMENGELTSTDHDGLIALTNLALIGSEIIAFRSAEWQSGNEYRLTGLLRGLFGTEWAMSTHGDREQFVMLDSAVQFVPLDYSDIGIPLRFACVRVGENPSAASWVSFTWQGEQMRPLSPRIIGAGRDADGDVTIKWRPRTRYPGTLIDTYENEAPEDAVPTYVVEIYDADFALAVKRTLYASDAEYVVYTLAEQQNDFGFTPTEMGVRIYQEAPYGSPYFRGRPGEETIEA